MTESKTKMEEVNELAKIHGETQDIRDMRNQVIGYSLAQKEELEFLKTISYMAVDCPCCQIIEEKGLKRIAHLKGRSKLK